MDGPGIEETPASMVVRAHARRWILLIGARLRVRPRTAASPGLRPKKALLLLRSPHRRRRRRAQRRGVVACLRSVAVTQRDCNAGQTGPSPSSLLLAAAPSCPRRGPPRRRTSPSSPSPLSSSVSPATAVAPRLCPDPLSRLLSVSFSLSTALPACPLITRSYSIPPAT